MDQLEGRNPVLECLRRHRRLARRLLIDQGAKPDKRIKEILELASAQSVQVRKVPRVELDKIAHGRVHNGVIAMVDSLLSPTTTQLINTAYSGGRTPLFVMASEVQYEHNLGAILRSCLGFGVNGLILPTHRGSDLSPVVQRVSMGAIEEIPVVRESMTSSIKHLKRAGIPIWGADMDGTPLGKANLQGPLAILLGSEGKGLSSTLRGKCDNHVSIPLKGNLESLNVSVAAAVLLYEKRRQDGWYEAT